MVQVKQQLLILLSSC